MDNQLNCMTGSDEFENQKKNMTDEQKRMLAEVEQRVLAKAKGQHWSQLQLRQAIRRELEAMRQDSQTP